MKEEKEEEERKEEGEEVLLKTVMKTLIKLDTSAVNPSFFFEIFSFTFFCFLFISFTRSTSIFFSSLPPPIFP